MDRKNILISLAVIVVVVGLIAYQQFAQNEAAPVEVSTVQRQEVVREVRSEVEYEIPGGSHTVDFIIALDEEGVITDVNANDLLDPDHQVRMEEFAMTLKPQLVGRKLSELEAVDRVGTSSLTTDAFNQALADLQAQL